jgi:ferric-dicitrate binding protein FerR (iron transport regulator)
MKLFIFFLLFSSCAFSNVRQLSPSVKVRVGRNTKIEPSKEATSLKLTKGVIRVMGKSEFSVVGPEVTFTTKDGDFEVAIFKNFVDLNVIRGEVEASSPHIQTFVPEIIKANQGFRYSRAQRKFLGRKYQIFLK